MTQYTYSEERKSSFWPAARPGRLRSVALLAISCWIGLPAQSEQQASSSSFTPSFFTPALFNSGATQVQLIELYTSEGCSSCPPADRWLSSLQHRPGLWQEFVPVAFHVDYWDDIGWPDRFASKAFSDRQYRYRRQGDIRQVYTPGFVVNGQEWRGWYSRRPLPDNDPVVGPFQLSIDQKGFRAEFRPAGALQHQLNGEALQLHVVLLGQGLQTPVKAGENRGRTLQHDFVALAWQTYTDSIQEGKTWHWQAQLPGVDPQHREQTLAIAAWVSRHNRQPPLQSVGGWLSASGVPGD